MNITHKSTPTSKGRQMLETLRQSVARALQKKRQLGSTPSHG
jgi:hypothetical protein